MSTHTSASGEAFPIENFVGSSSIVFYHYKLDDDSSVMYISPNVERLWGYKAQQFYDSASFWLDKIHPDDHERSYNRFYNADTQDERTLVYRFRHNEGHYIWLRDENTVILDDDGNPASISGIASDVTKLKNAENKVREVNASLEERIEERTRHLLMTNKKLKRQIQQSNKAEKKLQDQQYRLKLLELGINHIQDMVIIAKGESNDPLNFEIAFVNKALENVTGYSFSEIKGQTPEFLYGAQTNKSKLARIQQQVKENESIYDELVIYKKDGTPLWIDLEMTSFPSQEDGMHHWLSIMRDITKRKTAEQKLEQNKRKYRAYIELSVDGIFEITPDGSIVESSDRVCNVLGYAYNELLAMNVKELVYKKNDADGKAAGFPFKNVSGSEESKYVFECKDGDLLPVAVKMMHYSYDDEERFIIYIRDISKERAYHRALESSLIEKETLLAEVHHRVKNNLAVISGLLQMQIFNAKNGEISRELRESQSRIKSIATVHEKLYQSKSFANIPLQSYIDELVTYISETFGHPDINITIEKDIAPVVLTINQAVPCGLLLNEIITNAYKHAFNNQDKGIIEIHVRQDDDIVMLIITDNGSGLPDDLDLEESSSLGMKLISTLTRQLNGELEITTSPQTTFHISFLLDS